MKTYTATVTFISGNQIYYPQIQARNKEAAKLRVKLDRQRKGDEMFIRFITVQYVKSSGENAS